MTPNGARSDFSIPISTRRCSPYPLIEFTLGCRRWAAIRN
jgi:hypothetical protein